MINERSPRQIRRREMRAGSPFERTLAEPARLADARRRAQDEPFAARRRPVKTDSNKVRTMWWVD